MEREREREREEHDIGGDDDFVEESSEWIDVQHLDHSDLLDETFDFGKGGNSSLRSSRRRVQKHSAVVLTSQRLKKFTSNSNDSNISANELKHILEDFDEDQEIHHHDHAEQREEVSLATDPTVPHLTHASPSKPPLLATSLLNKISPNSKKSPTQQQSPPSNTTTITVPHQPTPPPPPRLKRNKPKITETQAALMILQWWNLKKQKRLLKFTQEGKWPFKTSNKVLAWILGYRVRKIFQSNEIQKIIASQKDLIRVLQELLQQYIHEPKINSPKTKFPVKTVEQTIDYWLTYLQRLQSSQSILPGADQIFAKSVIKQLLAEREKLIKSLYQDSQWIYFPKPGYRLFKRKVY